MNDYINGIKSIIDEIEKYDINTFYAENKLPAKAWKYTLEHVINHLNINDTASLDGNAICQAMEAIGYASKDVTRGDW